MSNGQAESVKVTPESAGSTHSDSQLAKPCPEAKSEPQVPSPNHQSVLKHIAFELREEFSGPLPHPRHLAQYDLVLPGAADRILSMAEQQQKHRMSLEKKVVEADIKRSAAGQIVAAGIAVLAFGCGTFLISQGQDVTGLVTMLGPLAALVSVFFYAENKRRTERESKAAAAQEPDAQRPSKSNSSPRPGKKRAR